MVRVYAPTSPMRVALGFGAASPLHVLLAAIAGAGLAPGMSVVDELMTKYFPQSEEETEGLTKLLTASTLGARVALVTTLVVALPIVEELFFRGILFGGLKKGRTLVVGILATTLFYTTYIMAGQLSPRFLVTTVALSLVLAWVRAESGTVLASIAAHVAVQAVQIAPLVRTGDPNADFNYPRTWVVVGVAAAVVALAAVRATRATRHHPPS
jgi:membrane protease YdiL (CAAX protease family)